VIIHRCQLNTINSTAPLSTQHCRVNTVKFDSVNSTVPQPNTQCNNKPAKHSTCQIQSSSFTLRQNPL